MSVPGFGRLLLAPRRRGSRRPDSAVIPRYVVLLPITHTPPAGDTAGNEIPARVRQALGLDDSPSWVIVSEHNIDDGPNTGLAPLPGQLDAFSYCFIPS